jgi:hypothetical protein
MRPWCVLVGLVKSVRAPLPAYSLIRPPRSDEERRPLRAGAAATGGQHHPVGWLEIGAVYLAAQHRHLVPQYQDLDVLGSAVAGELGQHVQHLAQ